MKYKAKISFAGIVTMVKNEIRELTNTEVIEDLLQAGYIEEIKEEKETKVVKNSKKK